MTNTIPYGKISNKYGHGRCYNIFCDKPWERRLSNLYLSKSLLHLMWGPNLLSDKIWVTRKSRINSEDRLRKYSIFSELILTIYSTVIVLLSIWNLSYPSSNANLLIVFGSIILLIVSINISSSKYGERALSMRNHYIKLEELYFQAKQAEEQQDFDRICPLKSQYVALLSGIENHSEYDYLRLRYNERNNTDTTLPQFTQIDYINFYLQTAWRFFFVIIIFFLPVIFFIVWNYFT